MSSPRTSCWTHHVPKLMDFGLARRDEGEITVTMEGQVLGTPAYMSPEQARGESHRVDGRSDVYSLGVILYQLLTGALPFPGNSRLQLHHVLHDDPEPPRRRDRSVPRDLEMICLKAMAKEPGQRYQTARDFADDLRRYAKGEPIHARPVSMLERTVKRLRRRPATTALLAAAVFVLVAAAWLWQREAAQYRLHRARQLALEEATKTHIEFYANVTRQRGVLQGVSPLEAARAWRRSLSYKLYRRPGKVEKVEAVNGRGELAGKEVHASLLERQGRSVYIDDIREPAAPEECRYEYKYNDQGQVTEEIASDAHGRVLWVFHYTAHGGDTSTGHFTDERGFPRPRAASGAAYVSINYTPDGWEREIRYLDRRGRPAPVQDGSYGLRQDRDARGLVVRQTLLDVRGRPMKGRKGFAAVRQTFDGLGQPVEWVYLGLDGAPALNADGIARICQTFDENGNAVEQCYFGLDGRPTLSRDGYARVKKTYDERGTNTGWTFYGLDGHLALHSRWKYAQTSFTVNERGQTLKQVYHGTDGRPTVTSPGVTKYVNTYDDLGNQVSFASFGLDDAPALDTSGVAKTVYAYDERGNRIREEYFGVDGRPVRSHGGFATVTHVFDTHGRELEWAFFDVDGRPVMHPDGHARGKRVLDSQGREVELAYFGLDGKPVYVKDGYARLSRTYDDRGNVTEEAYFDPNGKPAVARNGFGKVTRAYDDTGALIDVRYFGAGGEPIRLDFIRDWLVLAPIPFEPGQSPAMALAGEQIPDEAHLRPHDAQAIIVGDSQLAWRKHHAPEFFLDFNRVLERQTEYSVAYAVCYLVADQERKGLLLKIGSDDQALVYLNGQEILRVKRPRALTIDEDVVPNISLRQGTNVLVLKVVNETRDWSACVRLTDRKGNPLTDVKVALAP